MSIRSMTKVGGITIVVLLLLFCALGPAKLQFRTGLGWRIDHVVGYFGFTLMFWLAWQLLLRIAIAILRAHYTEWPGP